MEKSTQADPGGDARPLRTLNVRQSHLIDILAFSYLITIRTLFTLTISLQLIYYGRNPGIMYAYTIPRDSNRARANARADVGDATSHRPSTRDPSRFRSRSRDSGSGEETPRIRVVARKVASTHSSTGSDARRSHARGLGRTAAAQADARRSRSRGHDRRRYRGEEYRAKEREKAKEKWRKPERRIETDKS